MFGLYLSIDHAQWGWKKKKRNYSPLQPPPSTKNWGQSERTIIGCELHLHFQQGPE